MKDFQQRKKIRSLASSRWMFWGVLIVTIFLLKGAWGVMGKEKETSSALEQTKANLAEAQSREASLSTSVQTLQTSQGLEKEIRDKFDVAKSGEEVIMVVDPSEATDTGNQSPPSLWQKIGNWFKSTF